MSGIIRSFGSEDRRSGFFDFFQLRRSKNLLFSILEAEDRRINHLQCPDRPCMKRDYRNKQDVAPLLAVSNEERVLSRCAPLRPDLPVVCPGFGFDCPEESFRTVLFDALEGTRDSFLPGEPFRRRLVLLGPASPRCLVVGHPDPTRQWYVRVLDATGPRSSASKIEESCSHLRYSTLKNRSKIERRTKGCDLFEDRRS